VHFRCIFLDLLFLALLQSSHAADCTDETSIPFSLSSPNFPLSSSHLHRKPQKANHQAQALRASPRANSQETRKRENRENSNQLTCVLILSITLSTNSSGYGNNSGAHLSATHARVKACRSEVRCGMRSVVDTEARMSSIFILLLLLLL
jgi:hypothetical protein